MAEEATGVGEAATAAGIGGGIAVIVDEARVEEE